MAERLSNREQQYLAAQMGKVSRSFALIAPQVDAPLDDYLAAGYLICRVVDNIEDTMRPFSWKKQRYGEFLDLVEDPRAAQKVLATWENHEWPGLSDDEQRMMTRECGQFLWDIVAHLPQDIYTIIKRWTLAMVEGMARSNDPDESDFFTEHNGVRLPSTYMNYNQYCFYVAGTVGHMISDLAAVTYGLKGTQANALGLASESCGRALQKTNIVKDFASDLKRGIAYLPDEWLREIDYSPLYLAGAPAPFKSKVLLDVLAELDTSVNFVILLPQSAAGLRKAGLLMMMPAYETIILAAQQLPQMFTPVHATKISRATMGQSVIEAGKIALDDLAIHKYVTEMSAKVKSTVETKAFPVRRWGFAKR